MLEKTTASSILMSLKSLYQKSVIKPSEGGWQQKLAGLPSHEQVRLAMEDIGARIQWEHCARCGGIWNALTEEGDCVACYDARKAAEVHQVKLGELLVKSIGSYGLEKYAFSSFRIDNENQPAFEAARGFNPERDNLYIWGACGTGKTHLAGAILKACAAAGRRCKWTNSLYLSRSLRGKFPADEEAYVDDLARMEVLIIDDLGLARDSETLLRLIYELADKRLHAKRNGWIITSNLGLEALTKKFGDERLGSRLAGLFQFYRIGGNEDGRFPGRS